MLAAIGLLTLTALTFAPALGYPYVYEDRINPPLLWRGADVEFLDFNWRHPARFVSNLSYRATHAISLDPWADHAGNLVVHVMNTALLMAAVWPVLGSGVALFSGALFGLHALQTEAVVYVSCRPDLLVATGILLALCGVTYRETSLLLLGLIIAALSKETGIMAAPLAVLWAWRIERPIARWALLALGLAVVPLALGHWLEFAFAGGHFTGWTASLLEVSQHLAMLWYLLGKLIPIGLSIDHDWQWITPFWAMTACVAWIVVLHLQVTTWAKNWASFALVFTLVSLLPRLLLHDPESLHEHHMAAPMIGLAIGLPMAYLQLKAWAHTQLDRVVYA